MLLDASASRLVIIDVQSRLLAAVQGGERVAARCAILAKGASLLGVPVCATEQNPAGIGGTVSELAALIGTVFPKTTFSAGGDPAFAAWAEAGGTVVLCGTEAHVCVLQTALDLRRRGRPVAVVADAVGSRDPADREAALHRLRVHGVDIVTAEMVLFEWLGRYDRPEFRAVLPLIKALGPDAA